MIRLLLGNVGSGKTARIVREIVKNPSKRLTYSNIHIKNCPNVKQITYDMIIKRDVDEKGKETLSLNTDFWEQTIKKEGSINVVIDEAHTVLNPRRSMSKINIIMSDFLALLRRILGSNEAGYGELILITQLERRIDVIAREMSTAVQYHVCHYVKKCKTCGNYFIDNNENPEPQYTCSCGSPLYKENHRIEVRHFKDMHHYELWKENRLKSYHRRYFIIDIENYFDYYDTLQWDNVLSQY